MTTADLAAFRAVRATFDALALATADADYKIVADYDAAKGDASMTPAARAALEDAFKTAKARVATYDAAEAAAKADAAALALRRLALADPWPPPWPPPQPPTPWPTPAQRKRLLPL